MIVPLAYGSGHLDIELPDDRTTVIAAGEQVPIADERTAIFAALDRPVGAQPLRDWLQREAKVCIVFSDITRPTPNERLIPILLEYLAPHVPRESIILLNSTGTHRPNTLDELRVMLTAEVVEKYHVMNHRCEAEDELLQCGLTRTGAPALINRHVVEADVRIITGFIEPHFFAGFSGGPKGIMPGCAGLATVMSNHGATNIASPRAAFGHTRGNPIWEEMRDIALRVGPSFLLNVTLDPHRRITGVFAGDLLGAHTAGCEQVRQSAMQAVAEPFDIVVTTNSGYPLDQNLYQGVKGMSVAARIVKPGGMIVLACECRDGVPAASPFERLLNSVGNPAELLARLATPGFVRPEQWQGQIQALIQRRARVVVCSNLPDDTVRACHLEPTSDITATIREELDRLGPSARVGVLPHGPLTVPYLSQE